MEQRDNPMTFHQFKSVKLFDIACDKLAMAHPLDRLCHLVLTFTGAKNSPKEVNKRYRSVASLLRLIFSDQVKVVEPHKDGSVHFHIMGALQDGLATPHDAISVLVSHGLKWGDNPMYRVKRPVGRKARGYKGVGLFWLKPVESHLALSTYLTKEMRDPTLRKLKDWARAKLWTASKGVRVNWRMAIHGAAFEKALNLMMAEQKVTDLAALKRKLGRHWSADVLQRKWEEELKMDLAITSLVEFEEKLVRRLRTINKLSNNLIAAIRSKPRAWKQHLLIEAYAYREKRLRGLKLEQINDLYKKHGRQEAKRIAILKNKIVTDDSQRQFSKRPASRASLGNLITI